MDLACHPSRHSAPIFPSQIRIPTVQFLLNWPPANRHYTKGVKGSSESSGIVFKDEIEPTRGVPTIMHKPIKYVEKAVTATANAAWHVFDGLNRIKQNPSFIPKWSEKPLLKSWQKSKPPLGWPRDTDSLCPKCIPEIRQKIVDGKVDYKILLNQPVGEIKAKIIERDGQILMTKECPIHGHFEDVMSIDPAVFEASGRRFPGTRYPRPPR